MMTVLANDRPVCRWVQDREDIWESACGHLFQFFEDGPVENEFSWCPYCGGELRPVAVDVGS
jgi:uncharacterized protein with PIN domain